MTNAKSRAFGPDYVLMIQVRGASCSHAAIVIKAYHQCRYRHGLDGHCTNTVLGYRCRESKREQNPVRPAYNARVTCSNDVKRIVHIYQQSTLS